MKPRLFHLIRPVVIFLLLATGVSLLLASWLPIVIVLLAYSAFHLAQLIRLYFWLLSYPQEWEPPEAKGLWGEVFNHIYRLLRKENLARDELGQLIKRTEDSMSALRDGVVLLDRRGQLETWNQAAAYLLGLRMASDRGQALTNFVRHPHMMEYLQQADFSQPLVLAAPLNKERILEYSVTRFGADEYLILIRDITRLHQLEQMRKDFVANVSHELKTPLTIFKGYVETLGDYLPKEPPLLMRAVQQMGQQTQRMEALIDDLLLLSRLENTQQASENIPVCLMELLTQLVRSFDLISTAKQQRISIKVPAGLSLLGEQSELSSAFSNLLANAVYYSPEGAQIEIIWQQRSEVGCLHFKDNGVGIAAHHLPRLTERFYRPDTSRTTATGGTGLGLAIVKHVLLRHDAQLEITSTLGIGSCFSCCFPHQRLMYLNSKD